MDLSLILEKTRKKSDKIKRTREPVYIATLERPYETMEEAIFVTDSKPVTNQQQTDNKPITNWQQIDNKPITNKQQITGRLATNRQQTDNKTDNKPITIRQQTGNKPITNWSFSVLTGIQRKIMIFIFNECKKSLSKITKPLTLEYMSHHINTDKMSIKTSAYRLEMKSFLLRVEYKAGRGGWTKYELPKDVFHDILQNETDNKLITNWQQTDNKPVTQPVTQPVTTLSSSSSSDINTTTTELSDEWQKIDISSLESIGLTFGHLIQLQRSGIESTEIIQDSINHFAYDLIHNNKAKEIKTTAIGYFMGIMKRAGLYTAPDNYESEKDRTLRIYMETKKRQQEKQAAVEAELIDLSYNEWNFGLTEDEKKSLLPEHTLNSKLEGPKIAALKTYFKKNIWPEKSKIVFQTQVEEV